MKNKISISTIFLALFIFSIVSVSAFDACFNEGCAGSSTAIYPNKNTVYGSNITHRIDSLAMTTCAVSGSVYTPIVADFNNDNQGDVVIATTSDIQVYSSNCVLISQISIKPYSMPFISNFNGDAEPELTFLSEKSLLTIHIDVNTGAYSIIQNATYYSITNASYKWLMCNNQRLMDDQYHCLGFSNNKNVLNFNITPGSLLTDVQIYVNRLSVAPINYDYAEGYASIAYAPSLGKTNARGMVCEALSTTGLACEVIDVTDGALNGVSPVSIVSASGNFADVYRLSILPFSRGQPNFVYDIVYKKTNVEYSSGFFDINGQVLKNMTSGTYRFSQNNTGNLVVADYNRDGQNEVCYLYNASNTTVATSFRCLDTTLNNYVANFDVTSLTNFSHQLVVSQFNRSSNILQWATPDGVFSGNEKILNYSGTITVNNRRSPVLYQFPYSGGNAIVYSDTSNTYIVSESGVGQTCGNGICESYESDFSCTIDCGAINNGSCLSNSDCSQPYPFCFTGLCVSSFSNISCVDNSYCPLNASTCFNNYCIGAVYGGIPPTPGTETAGTDINIVWRLLFQGSGIWKFFVGMILLIICVGMLNTAINPANNGMIFMFVLGSCLVLFTLVSLISVWVVIFLVIVIGAFFLANMIFNKTVNEG